MMRTDEDGLAACKPDEETAGREDAKGGDGENTGRETFEVAAVAETEATGLAAGEQESKAENGLDSPLAENAPVAERMEKELSSEELYGRVCRNEEVRLKIIGEYLASVGRTAAPLTVGGVGAFATPPRKVGSIGDAGEMALLYFKGSAKVQ